MATTTRTRPIPHHFSGEMGPPQIDDLEECFTSLEHDLSALDAAIQIVIDASGGGGGGLTAAQVMARVVLGT